MDSGPLVWELTAQVHSCTFDSYHTDNEQSTSVYQAHTSSEEKNFPKTCLSLATEGALRLRADTTAAFSKRIKPGRWWGELGQKTTGISKRSVENLIDDIVSLWSLRCREGLDALGVAISAQDVIVQWEAATTVCL